MKVFVFGTKGNMTVCLDGEVINSGLNVIEAFMLLAGLCKDKARSVQIDIQEPSVRGLAEYYRRGLDGKQTIVEERAIRQLARLREIDRLESAVKSHQAAAENDLAMLAELKKDKASVAKKRN